jgi:hypothetical protein
MSTKTNTAVINGKNLGLGGPDPLAEGAISISGEGIGMTLITRTGSI